VFRYVVRCPTWLASPFRVCFGEFFTDQ